MNTQKLKKVKACIKVIGVGGGGGNAINNMINYGVKGVEFIAANTDKQVLLLNQAPTKIILGENLTKGLGAGANPEVGLNSAKESIDIVEKHFQNVDMLFIAAGMGGGTGTGASPIIADIAKRMGALTVGIVTKPFSFEGKGRQKIAEYGINNLKNIVDTLIIVPNNKLLQLTTRKTTILDAFKIADQVLLNAVKSISDIITQQGIINVDFADATTIMKNKGIALMGIGYGKGCNRAVEAAKQVLVSPLLEDISMNGAKRVLVNVSGDETLTLHEVSAAIELITNAAHEDANIIFGYVIDNSLNDEVRITVIATGFAKTSERIYYKESRLSNLISKSNFKKEISNFFL
jgi:cell division protein FtsZ